MKYAIKERIPTIKKAETEAVKQVNRKGKKIHLKFIFYALKKAKFAQSPHPPNEKNGKFV